MKLPNSTSVGTEGAQQINADTSTTAMCPLQHAPTSIWLRRGDPTDCAEPRHTQPWIVHYWHTSRRGATKEEVTGELNYFQLTRTISPSRPKRGSPAWCRRLDVMTPTSNAQIGAAAAKEGGHMSVSDPESELAKEREISVKLSLQCREATLQRWEAELGRKETQLELDKARFENKKLKEFSQQLQVENQRLTEALTTSLPESRSRNAAQQAPPVLPPSFLVETRVNPVDQTQEQVPGDKAWELTKLIMSQLTRMRYDAGVRGALGFATWSHEATDFSFSLELCPPPHGPPQGIRGGQVVRYRPHSLGTLRGVAPPWMRNQLLFDIYDLPLLIRRLLWVAERRIH